MPPARATLIGAGNGKGAWAQWIFHQREKFDVAMCEADIQQFRVLQRTVAALGYEQDCELHNLAVSDQGGATEFFKTNSPLENGLLDPKLLKTLWPNLKALEVTNQSAVTLNDLLDDQNEALRLDAARHFGHWLIIDCLPAARLLKACTKLPEVNVVIARVLIDDAFFVSEGTGLKEVDQILQAQGLIQVALEVTRHPAIGCALFVRDAFGVKQMQVLAHKEECLKLSQVADEKNILALELQKSIKQLTQAKAALEKQSQERALQLEQVGKERDEQVKLAHEYQAQIEQLAQAKVVAEKQLKERAQQLEQVGKARDEQAKLAQERHSQIEQLQVFSIALQKNGTQVKQFKEFQQELENSLIERICKVLASQIDACVKTQTAAFSKFFQSNLAETKEGLQGVVNASEKKSRTSWNFIKKALLQ